MRRSVLKTFAILLSAMPIAARGVAAGDDTDGDGIIDTLDVCSNTPDGVSVDTQGRPLGDVDGDCDADLFDFAFSQDGFTGPLFPCFPEVCDGLDNDCDGVADDNLSPNPCPNQLGVCTGSVRTCAGGAWQACSGAEYGPAYEATEFTCDGLDNDCNGQTDEGFLNQVTGKYDADQACGSCVIDCTAIFDRPNAFGTCDAVAKPTCIMECVAGFFDFNSIPTDGCEFFLDLDAVYVSTTDPSADDDAGCGRGPVGTGAAHRPCLSIAKGIEEATPEGRSKVLVADGVYSETTVTLVNGVSLYGGYRADTWERHVSTTQSIVSGSDFAYHKRTIVAAGITQSTSVDGFVIYGQNNTNSSGNSYAIHVTNSSGLLQISNNFIIAGAAGPGSSGESGNNGTQGMDGTGRDSGGVDPADYDAFIATGPGLCDASNDRWHTNGGANSCGADSVNGGRGGGNRCAPSGDSEYSGRDGGSGEAGAGALGGNGGAGGDAGNDGEIDRTCYLPGAPMVGADGADAAAGVDANPGRGCTSSSGSVAGGVWVAGSGTDGSAGGNGGGGGGGGAGGGGECTSECNDLDRLGAHGGGGGAGGCGGARGVGGSGGGGSFGVFINGGIAPVITNNTFWRGTGGSGGSGGAGGAGGKGGLGGTGGICPGSCYCYASAGAGGEGGDGGHGSGAGGGCGGSVFGVYTSGIGSPSYCDGPANNIFLGGTSGAGGNGGLSIGNAGESANAGIATACSFN